MDIYAEITDRIIAELEKGNIPWAKPWVGVNEGAISHGSGKPYSLLNQMLLGEPGEYLTFKQCQQEGGKVKKGSKARMVVFWKIYSKEKTNAAGEKVFGDDGKPVMEGVPVLRYFNVFHINDCEGIKPRIPEPEMHDTDPIEEAERVLENYVACSGVTTEHKKQDRAYYRPSDDLISLPLLEQFADASEYYSTVFHEATHSTGHSSRLNRFAEGAGAAAFGSETYSKEELVAEIGAAAILNELKIETETSFRNSAAYIQSWLQALKNDKRMIVSAAGRAEKAVRMILGTDVG